MKKQKTIALGLFVILLFGISNLLVAYGDTSWSVNVTVSLNSFSDSAVFGTAPNATSSFDSSYDLIKAPIPPQGIYTYYIYPNNPSVPVNYQKLGTSIVGLSNGNISFTYNIQTIGESGQITISWAPVNSIPSSSTLLLLNGTTVLANMGQVNQYNFIASSDAIYSFTITIMPTVTPTPTATPITNPTQAPTSNPTTNPTQQPTSNPATNPTTSTTTTPTQNPISPPTPTPTAPELSAILLLPMVALILFSVVAIKLKKAN